MNSSIDKFCLEAIKHLVRNCPNDTCAPAAMRQIRALLDAWDKVNARASISDRLKDTVVTACEEVDPGEQ